MDETILVVGASGSAVTLAVVAWSRTPHVARLRRGACRQSRSEGRPVSDLFSPLRIGALDLPNRIWMSAMTRTRATPDNVPTELMAEYFAQRADALAASS